MFKEADYSQGPSLQEFRRTTKELQRVLQTLEKEIPDTAATMRLSGMEMTDCIEELSLLRSIPTVFHLVAA